MSRSWLSFIVGCLRWEKLWNHITIILLLLFKENITSIKAKSRFVTKDTISLHRENNPIYNLMHFFFYHVCFCFNFLKQGSCRSINNWRLYRKKIEQPISPGKLSIGNGTKMIFFQSIAEFMKLSIRSSPYLSLLLLFN